MGLVVNQNNSSESEMSKQHQDAATEGALPASTQQAWAAAPQCCTHSPPLTTFVFIQLATQG